MQAMTTNQFRAMTRDFVNKSSQRTPLGETSLRDELVGGILSSWITVRAPHRPYAAGQWRKAKEDGIVSGWRKDYPSG
jgi:hypothetical protein